MPQNILSSDSDSGEIQNEIENSQEFPGFGKRNGDNLNEETMRNLIMDDVRENAKKLKISFMGQIETKLSEMMDGIVDTLDKVEYQPNTSLFLSKHATSIMKDKRKARILGKFPEKQFISRPSPLTELLEVPHFKTIHHIFIATLALVMINIIITELIENGTVDLGLECFQIAFGKPGVTFSLLFGMHFVTIFLVYPIFSLWSKYHQILEKESTRRLLDYLALIGIFIFMILFIYVPALVMWKNPLPPGSGCAVTMEQCRMLMKMYAFVRSNVPKTLNFKNINNKKKNLDEDEIDYDMIKIKKSNTSSSLSLRNRNLTTTTTTTTLNESWITKNDEIINPCPNYSKYLYFLYAPTLIYMDSYPRTNQIRWNYVSWNIAQLLGCIWYLNFIISRTCIIHYSKFGHPNHPMNITQFIQTIFSSMVPGTMALVLTFFLLLHAWQNIFAEILCFGDRLFYKDWWNCSSFASYYKTWNIIVHDWLYTYVFKDAWEFGLGKIHSTIPTTLVFLISSLFHEYILSFSFNFFFPVLLTLFGGFGFAFVFIRSGESAIGNVLMWMGLISGTGIIFALYGLEYYARLNCPLNDEISAWDFFKPKALSLSCGAVVMTFN